MSISPSKRFRVLTRDGFKCRYCGAAADATTLEVDHVQPKSKGGADEESNLVTSCFACNRGKRDSIEVARRFGTMDCDRCEGEAVVKLCQACYLETWLRASE